MNWLHSAFQHKVLVSPPPPRPSSPPPPAPSVRLYKSELEAPAALHVNFAAFLRSHLSQFETRRGDTDAADDEVKVTRQKRTADIFMNAFFIPYLLFVNYYWIFHTKLCTSPPCTHSCRCGCCSASCPWRSRPWL